MKRSTELGPAAVALVAAASFTMILASCARSGESVVEAPMMLVDGSAEAVVAADLVTLEAGAPAEFHGGVRFDGTYYCPQGRTALKLTIDNLDSGERATDVTATFEFDFTAGSPVHGAFTMSGAWNSKTRQLVLSPNDWTEDPNNGWVMVGLRGTVSKNGQSINGMIEGTGCSTFSVRRTRGDD